MGFAHIATALSLSSLTGTDLLFVGLVGGFGLVCLVLWAAWLAGMWKVFVKLGRPGWTCLVPVWSNWQLGCAVGPRPLAIAYAVSAAAACITFSAERLDNAFLLASFGLLLLTHLAVCYFLSRAFGRGAGYALGLAVLPFLFVPFLALSDDEAPPYEAAPASASAATLEDGAEVAEAAADTSVDDEAADAEASDDVEADAAGNPSGQDADGEPAPAVDEIEDSGDDDFEVWADDSSAESDDSADVTGSLPRVAPEHLAAAAPDADQEDGQL